MIGIYKITSPSGKIYIGQSIDIEYRIKSYKKLRKCKAQTKLFNSLKKYGPENHIFEIIEECSIDQLNEREIYWGLHYNVLDKNGLNLKLGDANGLCSEETKQKISKANKNKAGKYYRNIKTKQKISKANIKHINQYDLEGNFIKKWDSIKDAEDKNGKGIKDNLAGKTKTSHGFVWSYDKFNLDKTIHGNCVIICQYNKNMEFVKEWNSISEIEKKLNFSTSNISACCKGRQKTAYGYKWKYKSF